MKKRIWELDAFRGICILGMVAIHFVFDLTELYRLVDWQAPTWFHLLQQWGGILFILLSGICATLGRQNVKRGAVVLCCGLLVSAVTVGLYAIDFGGKELIIWFGVLHCLGVCMLLWHFFKKLPTWALIALGLPMVAVGLWLWGQVFETPAFMVIFGFVYPGFASSDYFPLLPYLGFFLLGGALGRLLYAKKESRFPGVNPQKAVVRFFTFCGRQSLWIYLLHQPLLTALFWLIA